MKLTILITINLWILRTQAICPLSCTCTDTTISCKNQKLKTVPDLNDWDVFPNFLDLSGNNFLFVNQDDFNFPKSDEVIILFLNNSRLDDLGEEAFDEMEMLQILNLSDNYLSHSGVPETIIEDLQKMHALDLSRNYFDGIMPRIRSQSLVVLALNNARISVFPRDALKYLPKLQTLYLEQNNLETLPFEVFEKYEAQSLILKLANNPWSCNCDNLKNFRQLADRKLIDTAEPYECTTIDDIRIDIFGNEAEEYMSSVCGGSKNSNLQDDDLVPMNKLHGYNNKADEGFDISNLEDDDLGPMNKLDDENNQADESIEVMNVQQPNETIDKEINEQDLLERKLLTTNCWQIFTDVSSSNGFFTLVAVTTVISFLVGLSSGILICKILYIVRYKKLEQGSDSQVQLLRA